MSTPQVVNNHGIGFLGLLGILFIGLKLTKVISWSWWLVLLPLYGPITLVAALWALVGIAYVVCAGKRGKRRF